MVKLGKIQRIVLVSTACIGFLSVLTPVIYHISPNYLYQFWPFGFTLSFGLSTSEVVVSYNSEVEFLIPALSSILVIAFSSGLILKSSLKKTSENEFKRKIALIGGILLIITSIFIMVIWHLIYTLGRGYPVFWGSSGGDNYYTPSFGIYLQFVAGGVAVIVSVLIKRSEK